MLTLYTYYRSTAAYRVRIALNYKTLDYKSIEVNLIKEGGEQHLAQFTDVNPQGLVPVLQDQTEQFTQSIAIMEYLEERYPSPNLLPAEINARSFVRSLSQMIACEMHPLNNLRVLQYLQGPFKHNDDDKLTWYHHWLRLGFDALEQRLANHDLTGKCCYGDTPTMVDMCLIPQIYNANRFEFDMSDYPTLQRINDYCLQMEAFQKATPEESVKSNQ